MVERQSDGGLSEKTAVAMKPKPTPLGLGCYHSDMTFRVRGAGIQGSMNTAMQRAGVCGSRITS